MLFHVYLFFSQIPHDRPELLKRRFKVFNDILSDDIGIGEVAGGF
jgi:hypothetical protein